MMTLCYVIYALLNCSLLAALESVVYPGDWFMPLKPFHNQAEPGLN
jgi:hypothetical protein